MVVEEINELLGTSGSKLVIIIVGIVTLGILTYQISLAIRQAKVYTTTKKMDAKMGELVNVAKEIKVCAEDIKNMIKEDEEDE